MTDGHIEKIYAVICRNWHLVLCEVPEDLGIFWFVAPDFERKTSVAINLPLTGHSLFVNFWCELFLCPKLKFTPEGLLI